MTGASPAELSVYIHVPFCVSKCAYCDFHSAAASTHVDRLAYVAAVRGALRDERVRRLVDASVVPTVYFGGGTPTLLGETLASVVGDVLSVLPLLEGVEVTVETNPETTSAQLVQRLVDVGVNRFSLGVQSFDDSVLTTLGRCHDAASAQRAARILKDAEVPFSVDLICGVPGQTIGSWMSTCIAAIDTGAEHASVYPLSIEEGTPLDLLIESGAMREPRPDVAAEMMVAAEELLGAAGLERYEVASYARAGARSKHNVGYWTGRPYLGLGPSAASMLPAGLARTSLGGSWGLTDRDERVRFVLSQTAESFSANPIPAEPATQESLTAEEVAREDAMLGLRLVEGISADEAMRAGVDVVLGELAESGLVEFDAESERWATTQRGWLLGNEVFGRVWAGE